MDKTIRDAFDSRIHSGRTLVTGLPGSGKSTYAKEYVERAQLENGVSPQLIQLDHIAVKDSDAQWLVDVTRLRHLIGVRPYNTVVEGTSDNMQDVYRIGKFDTIVLLRPESNVLRAVYAERCKDVKNLFQTQFCSMADWQATKLNAWMEGYFAKKLKPLPSGVSVYKLVRTADNSLVRIN